MPHSGKAPADLRQDRNQGRRVGLSRVMTDEHLSGQLEITSMNGDVTGYRGTACAGSAVAAQGVGRRRSGYDQ